MVYALGQIIEKHRIMQIVFGRKRFAKIEEEIKCLIEVKMGLEQEMSFSFE